MLSGGLACYEVYETKDGRWLAVGALEPKFWAQFCRKIGKESLIDKLYAPAEKQDEMKQEIQKTIRQKTLEEWMDIFAGTDACVSPVLTLEEMVENPHVKERGMIQELEAGKYVANPIKLSETP